ncbi:MAG: nucleoside monophosphate kinase [Minisyncoccia bacterium]|jgi:adenylate kinase
MIFVFLTGKPACGKDTQAKLLSRKLKAKVVTTSQELDKFFKNYKKKYIYIKGIKINVQKQKKIKEQGKLVAFKLVAYIIENLIKKAIKNRQSLIFAGSPRSIYEAKTYLEIFKKYKNIKYVFIYLKISDKTVFERIKLRYQIEKREDDKPSRIKERLKYFRNEILPMINWLKDQNLLIEIDGEDKPQKIAKKILSYLKNL